MLSETGCFSHLLWMKTISKVFADVTKFDMAVSVVASVLKQEFLSGQFSCRTCKKIIIL